MRKQKGLQSVIAWVLVFVLLLSTGIDAFADEAATEAATEAVTEAYDASQEMDSEQAVAETEKMSETESEYATETEALTEVPKAERAATEAETETATKPKKGNRGAGGTSVDITKAGNLQYSMVVNYPNKTTPIYQLDKAYGASDYTLTSNVSSPMIVKAKETVYIDVSFEAKFDGQGTSENDYFILKVPEVFNFTSFSGKELRDASNTLLGTWGYDANTREIKIQFNEAAAKSQQVKGTVEMAGKIENVDKKVSTVTDGTEILEFEIEKSAVSTKPDGSVMTSKWGGQDGGPDSTKIGFSITANTKSMATVFNEDTPVKEHQNMYLEDELPADVYPSARIFQIRVRMNTLNEANEWIAFSNNGYSVKDQFNALTQNDGETYDAFKARAKANAPSYGVYEEKDASDVVTSRKVLVYFGDVPGNGVTYAANDADFKTKIMAISSNYTEAIADAYVAKFGENSPSKLQVIGYDVAIAGTVNAELLGSEVQNIAYLHYNQTEYSTASSKTKMESNSSTIEKVAPGYAKVIKKDEDGAILPGATFVLEQKNGSEAWETCEIGGTACTGVTDAAGELLFGPLVDGTYRFRETAAPEGYVLNTATMSPETFVIDVLNDSEGVTATAVNKRVRGDLEIKKVDKDNAQTVLKDAQFILYKEEGGNKQYYKKSGTDVNWEVAVADATKLETNDHGIVTVQELDWGTYYVQEVKAPSGYITDGTPVKVEVTKDTIKANNGLFKVTVQNKAATVAESFAVNKELKGGTLAADDFEFTARLIQGDQAKVTGLDVDGKMTAKNDGSGKVSFASQTYTKADTYVYEVSEKNGGTITGGINYDGTVYYVKVEVTSDNNGALTASVTYYEDSALLTEILDETDVVFTNAVLAIDTVALDTKVTDPATGDTVDGTRAPGVIQKGSPSENEVIVDTVSYTGLKPNTRYVIDGSLQHYTTLADIEAYREYEENGNGAIVKGLVDDSQSGDEKYAFTTSSTGDGEVEVIYSFNGKNLGLTPVHGSYLVAYETIYEYDDTKAENKGNKVIEHTDSTDADQTIHYVHGSGSHLYSTSYTVTKEWADSNDVSGDRPTKIQVQLYRDGVPFTDTATVIGLQELNEGNNWTYTWTDLPEYQDGTHTPSVYLAKEVEVPINYLDEGQEKEADANGIITNTHKAKDSKAEILKVDQDGKALAGAVLALYDAEGNVVAEWTSTESAYELADRLIPGAIYTLKEKTAPAGYLLAQDVSFKAEAIGTVTKVKMTDIKKDESYRVEVTKYLTYEGKNRSMNFSFYTALFWDEACTQRASEVKELKLENSYTTKAVFDGLAAGTYYLAETDANGVKVDESDPEVFYSPSITNGTIELNTSNKTSSATITNDITQEPPGGLLLEDDAVIKIDKKVVAGSKDKKVTDTFYFTIYSDAEKSHIIETQSLTLDNQAEGSVRFEELAYGSYYVAESDEAGIPVDESFAYAVAVSEEGVTVNGEQKNAEVTITNDAGTEKGMKVRKAVDKAEITTEGVLTYTITVKNLGDVAMTNVVIKDYVPDNTRFLSVENGGESNTEDGKEYVIWTIDRMKPGQSIDLKFKVKVENCVTGTVIKNTAFLRDDDGEETLSNEVSTTVTGQGGKPGLRTRNGSGITTSRSVKTGDDSVSVVMYLIVMLVALAVIVWYKRRRV